MSDDLSKLWDDATPVAAPEEDLAVLWQRAAASAAPEQPSLTTSVLRGGAQGATLGFGDEVGGLIQALGTKYLPESLGGGGDAEKARSLADLYRLNRDTFRRENQAAEAAHSGGYLAGNLAGGLITAPALPGGQAKGLAQLVKAGLALGSAGGLGTSDADLTRGDYQGAARDTAVGGLLGAGSGFLGAALGKAGKAAAGKVAAIDEQVARAAAKAAEAETATARSAAGHAAQDAYRQLEHLRELGRLGQLTPEQAAVAQQLASELGDRAAAKLLPAAAAKEATAKAYSEALSGESARAKELAAQKLSGSELKQQLGARLKRYGLPAAIGATLGGIGFGGHGMLTGAALGGALGNNFRPVMHSLLRMGSQPVVQRPVFSALSRLAGDASALAAPAGRTLTPEVGALISALRNRGALAGDPSSDTLALEGVEP